ncbi:MAG: efflux RND transporter periplasmic adaptor subunit [Desulfobulbaceae bacterium]|nr:efflux RND transporter periplasmic adaptor subunit [Desulfobulbaceae bacterium]
MKNKSKFLSTALPVLVLLAGVGIAVLLAISRSAPKKMAHQTKGALVRIMEVHRENRRAEIHSTGTVQASRQISIIAQVGGQVSTLAPQCVAGGFIKKDELIFTIKDDDYRLAEEQALAAVAKAEADLATARGKAEVARLEWERFGDKTAAVNPLVLHEPQLKTSEANLAAARAGLAKAKLNFDRTRVRAPFDCLILSEELGVGLTIRAGSPVAEIVGTDQAEVIVPLPLAELPWCVIPRMDNQIKGSAVTLTATFGGHQYSWRGEVTRGLGAIDPKGRMARLAIRVDDPYHLKNNRQDNLDLAMGMFVNATIHGNPINKIVALPRKAIRPESTVWLMDSDQKLRLRKVTVARFTDDEALVSQGLDNGDQVVLTTLNGAADGMALRPVLEGEKP